MTLTKRHFTAVVNSKEYGLYVSSSPSSAARKIVSKLCISNKTKKVEFFVREITQGSKKKTYGLYLGEMKKLANPIELKGRVIRYAPEVHLKKKSATKPSKKTGKKIRGGEAEGTGTIELGDFFIKNYSTTVNKIVVGQYTNPNSFNTSDIPDVLIKKNNFSSEPYLFFGKPDYIPIRKNYNINHYPLYYYYVAYNRGFGPLKTANFKTNYTKNNDIKKIDINEIPEIYLLSLKKFLDEKRISNPSFCDTIYAAVEQELSRREQQKS